MSKGAEPGPGSYNEDTSTIAATFKAQTKKALLNTISSAGNNSGVGFIGDSTMSINKKGLAPTNFTIGSRMFMDSTSREDFKHYLPNNTNNTIALKNLGPGTYFKDKSPFLKRSYNASLPATRFY